MDLKNLNPDQRDALLDILVLGMYSDAHLARAEDARIERILDSMGFEAKFEREREFDAAVTRVRKYGDPTAAAQASAKALAQALSSTTDRNQVTDALAELIGSDARVSPEETRFLNMVKAALGG